MSLALTAPDGQTYRHGQYRRLSPQPGAATVPGLPEALNWEEVMIEEVIDLDHIWVRFVNSETFVSVRWVDLSGPLRD